MEFEWAKLIMMDLWCSRVIRRWFILVAKLIIIGLPKGKRK